MAGPEMLALPISLLLTSSLGDVCHALRQYEEALGYYELAGSGSRSERLKQAWLSRSA